MSKILIVEDEESIAELEKDYLELSGFEVEIENDGEAGTCPVCKKKNLNRPQSSKRSLYARGQTHNVLSTNLPAAILE